MKQFFNLEKFANRRPKRIKDRGINWKQQYPQHAGHLKKKFDKIIGPGSYYRWQGHDYTTNSDYFVVIGPAMRKDGSKAYFVGIKKMPPPERRKKIYAPSGKYFVTIMGAISHAIQKWGIRMPPDQTMYDLSNLENIKIPRRVKA